MISRPLHLAHLATLRRFVAQSEASFDGVFPSTREVLDLSERLAVIIQSTQHANDLAIVGLRDVELLTRVGRVLIDSADPKFFRGGEAQVRLALGQEVLDVRDAIESALIAVGRMPERRGEERT